MKTKDLTQEPTWQGVLPSYLFLIKHGTHKGRIEAILGLQKMAKEADMYVESVKSKSK